LLASPVNTNAVISNNNNNIITPATGNLMSLNNNAQINVTNNNNANFMAVEINTQQQQQQQQQCQQQQQVLLPEHDPVAQQQQQLVVVPAGQDDASRYHGTELVMLYDYKAQAPDDLSVRRGEILYTDLNNQTVEGWLWVYGKKTGKYGFIPKAYTQPYNRQNTNL